MVDLAEGKDDCKFEVLPEDIDFHLARKFWMAQRSRRAWKTLLMVYGVLIPVMVGLQCSVQNPIYFANLRCAVLWFDPQGFITRARYRQQSGDITSAIADCKTALNIDPANKAAHQELAYCLLDQGQYEEAWQQNEQSNQSAWEYLDVKATIQLRRGENVAAALNQHKAGELSKQSGFYLNERNIWASAGMYSNALDAAKSALAAANSDSLRSDAYTAEARSLVKLERYDEALEACKQAIALKPLRALTHAVRSEALLGKGDDAGAVEAATTALTLNHVCVRALKVRAQALDNVGRPDDAVADWKALALFGWNPWLDD
jgi:tetratricopeptide (TPR) repeat protein